MLTVSIEQIPLASYALTENNVSLIRSVTVVNDSSETAGNLTVRISFDPVFAETVEEHIDSLPPQGRWSQNDLHLSVETSWLCNLTEQVTVETTVEVLSEEGEVLAKKGVHGAGLLPVLGQLLHAAVSGGVRHSSTHSP